MEVQNIGSDVEVMRYTQLRPLDWKPATDEVANSIEYEFMEQPTKNPRVLSNPEKQSRVRRAIKVRSSAELLHLHSKNCSVPLNVVPRQKGNLEKELPASREYLLVENHHMTKLCQT